MAVEYLGLSNINGPLAVLEGVRGAAYDEIVEMTVKGSKEPRLGRIIEIYDDRAVIQVYEGTDGMALRNTHTRLTGHPMEIGVSEEMLGRTFNGIGAPIDGLGDIEPDMTLDVNGKPLNPVTREYPRNYIRTGISAIDGLTTLIRGQKLPIFSGNGPSPRPAGGPDRPAGVPGGGLRREIRHRLRRHGREIRRGRFFPPHL